MDLPGCMMPDGGEACREYADLYLDHCRLKVALMAIHNLQDRSFTPQQDLISAAVMIARNALQPQSE